MHTRYTTPSRKTRPNGLIGKHFSWRELLLLTPLFDSKAAIHLSERQLSDQQRLIPQADGRVLLRAKVRDTLELRWWLLGFGDKVTVLGPGSVREEFRNIATHMASMYQRSIRTKA